MATNTEIIAAVARAVVDPTYNKRTQAIYGQILTNAQDYLVEQLECMRKIDTSIVLVAGTDAYDMPSSYIKFPNKEDDIVDGAVAVGTNGRYILTPTSPVLLNYEEPGWRGTSAGTPAKFYILPNGATYKFCVYPKPSATFISSYGSSTYLDMIYRPAAISANTDRPFDNNPNLQGLELLLKLHAIWQIKLEDLQFADADRLKIEVAERLEKAKDVISSISVNPISKGFVSNFGGSE